MKIEELYHIFLEKKHISIDTRNIQPNWIFLAIKGDRFDANTFTKEALDKGASYVIIDNSDYYIDFRTILVEDSLKTLQQLAQYHRKQLNIPIIGLTGSNGKTTTKELIQAVLSAKYNSKATIGNLNNHIGVPLTLLSFDETTEIGIVEMGANHQKEIEFLCEIAQPDFGYITNFGKAHLEGFGGVEGVIKGKSELYSYLRNNKKKVFINKKDKLQIENTSEIPSFSFGNIQNESDIVFNNITANPFVAIDYNTTTIKSNLIGLYNADNIMAAITIGLYFNIEIETIKKAIENYTPSNNRSQIILKGNCEIILDAYNANPSSMKVAIENFQQLQQPNKTIILGDMFELGDESKLEHQNIVLQCNSLDIPCHFIGEEFFKNRNNNPLFRFHQTFEEFQKELELTNFENQTILIKGSRGMALERTLNYMKFQN